MKVKNIREELDGYDDDMDVVIGVVVQKSGEKGYQSVKAVTGGKGHKTPTGNCDYSQASKLPDAVGTLLCVLRMGTKGKDDD